MLIDAWNSADDLPGLKIAGPGPLADVVDAAARANPRIEYLGLVPPADIQGILGGATFSIIPSMNYEGFPKAIVESFAVGTPVIAAEIGSLTELIDSSRTGFLFESGSATSLAQAVRDAASATNITDMRRAARQEYLGCYGIDRNYDLLMDIYASAIESRRSTG
jgi:glycosyltransferase involved in cell wall biosynthesis